MSIETFLSRKILITINLMDLKKSLSSKKYKNISMSCKYYS